MGQKQKWVSVTAGDFSSTLDNLKGLVTESHAPPKDVEQVVGQIKSAVREAIGRSALLGLQKLNEAVTILGIAGDLFVEDGLETDAADIMAIHKELVALKDRLQERADA